MLFSPMSLCERDMHPHISKLTLPNLTIALLFESPSFSDKTNTLILSAKRFEVPLSMNCILVLSSMKKDHLIFTKPVKVLQN